MNRALLGLAVVLALAAVALSLYVVGHPLIQQDIEIERAVQAINWGPLALTFPFFSWVGSTPGLLVQIAICIAVLLFNRRAWLFGLGAVLSGSWWLLGSSIIHRARPTTHEVLHVTEHINASSYPSGHTIFIVTATSVLMLAFGNRLLPRAARPFGWLLVALLIAAMGIARIYTGSHWPSDVLGGLLIASAWVTLLAAFDPASGRLHDLASRIARSTLGISRREPSPAPPR